MIKRVLLSSIICSSAIYAGTVDIGSIDVESSFSKEVENISQEEIKSADLAEALEKNSADITLIRRSGIANDIILRGQKKDNINITIDNAKVCGACPNRMDAPTSHIVTNNVESVEILEGPYDVENFGTLSGIVKVNTIAPKEGMSGDININIGSFGYNKLSANIGGGDEKVKYIFGFSRESGEQYEDGDGNTFSQQLANSVASGTGVAGNNYSSTYADMDAYQKLTYYSKFYIQLASNQMLKLSYMANRSTDVLYPSTPMDAESDDSDIFNLEYTIDLNKVYSKRLTLEAYTSRVDHPMSTKYRNAGAVNYRTNHMKSKITGIKLKDELELSGGILNMGIDTSKRVWDGIYYMTNVATGAITIQTSSLPDVHTQNVGLFAEYKKSIENVDLAFGLRYDTTDIEAKSLASTSTANKDNDYQALNANIRATLNMSENLSYFAGFGKASRVPDAKELYWGTTAQADLEQTTNYQFDIGMKQDFDSFGYKAKVFYSMLDDYIYYNATTKKYTNLDATIYGASLDGYYAVNNNLTLDATLSYLKGQKDDALANQDDKDLADIAPLKVTFGIDYVQGQHSIGTNITISDKWSDYDEDNGEQEIDSYTVVDAKYNYKYNKNINISIGVDNIFDETYAVSNTYKDLTLINGGGDVMLMNEAGRYVYTNFQYKF
jgi:iron complex outermembrane receptor protein